MKNFEIVCRGETEFRPTFWSPSLGEASLFNRTTCLAVIRLLPIDVNLKIIPNSCLRKSTIFVELPRPLGRGLH